MIVFFNLISLTSWLQKRKASGPTSNYAHEINSYLIHRVFFSDQGGGCYFSIVIMPERSKNWDCFCFFLFLFRWDLLNFLSFLLLNILLKGSFKTKELAVLEIRTKETDHM